MASPAGRRPDVSTVWQAVVTLSRNRTVSDHYKRFIIVEGHVDEEVANTNFANQCRADASAAREWLRDGVRHADLNAVLSRELPTLVIVPAHDPLVHVDGLRQLLATRANVSLFVDDEQGHGWNQAAVQRQLGVMLDFFAAEDGRGLAATA